MTHKIDPAKSKVQVGRDHALDFDGVDDYVEVLSQVMPSGDFTICAWLTVVDPTTDKTIAGNIDLNDDKGAHLDIGQGKWKFIFMDGGIVVVRGTTVVAGETQFQCGVFDSGTATLYENAKQTAQQSGINYQQPTATNFRIGLEAHGGWGNYWNGTISSARIYDRALSSSEVSELYDGANITEGLVSHWDFSEGSGSTLYDRAGNNDGTIDGAIWKRAVYSKGVKVKP